jgi:hypothetical protein
MGKHFHEFHDAILGMEHECHFGGSRSNIQIGKNSSNKNDCNNFQFNKIIFRQVNYALEGALIHYK